MYLTQLLDYPDAEFTRARRLNNRGQVIGEAYATSFNLVSRAVLWEAQYALDLGDPNPPYGASRRAEGINDAGDAVIYGDFDGFLFRNGTRVATPGLASPAAFPKDINNAGLVTGWDLYQGCFLFDTKTGAPPTLVTRPDGGKFQGLAINNNGQVLGASPAASGNQLHFYANNTVVDLGAVRLANDLNDGGKIVGARIFDASTAPTAFLCDPARSNQPFQDLGALSSLGHTTSAAWGINRQGDVVGESSPGTSTGPQSRAFLCPAGGAMQDLNALVGKNSGWTLRGATSINDRGQIAGYGDYQGKSRGFLLTPAKTSFIPPDIAVPDVRYHPEKLLGQIFALVAGTAGVWFGPGTRPVPIDPEGRQWAELSEKRRDVLTLLAMTELAASLTDRPAREELERIGYEAARRAFDRLAERQ